MVMPNYLKCIFLPNFIAVKLFETDKTESLQTRLQRLYFNFFPAYRSTGARVKFISADYKEIHVRMRLFWRTRNYVGTVFGGSLFGALDPLYMIQLIKLLGDDYVVWDSKAKVDFKRPVSKPVYARFLIKDELLDEIRETIAKEKKMHLWLPAQFEDKNGKVYATVDKLLYIADKSYYKQQRKSKEKRDSK
jgi:acyl-coenzyme A thioesterase PaaI-like protein